MTCGMCGNLNMGQFPAPLPADLRAYLDSRVGKQAATELTKPDATGRINADNILAVLESIRDFGIETYDAIARAQLRTLSARTGGAYAEPYAGILGSPLLLIGVGVLVYMLLKK